MVSFRRHSSFPGPSLGPFALVVLMFLAASLQVGCASYSDRIQEAHRAAIRGEPQIAIELINEELDVDHIMERPADLGGNRALLLMERALLLQSAGLYRESTLDFISIDDRLEWIDLSTQTGAEILRYLYSDAAGAYRPPPHERLLLNLFNMINFLATQELEGARVEARRFHILQEYYLEESLRSALPTVLGLGNYLAGAAFEASQDYPEAVRFYARAYLYGTWPEGDPNRLLDLIRLLDYRGADLGTFQDRFAGLRKAALQRERITSRVFRDRYGRGDTLVVVQTGMVPYRRAQRMPIERALAYSNRSPHSSLYISSNDRRQALILYQRGSLNFINAATLTEAGLPPRRVPQVKIGGRSHSLRDPVSLSAQIYVGWDYVLATAVAAAISRAVLRATAGTVTRVATDHVAQEQGATPLAAGLLSWLLSLAVEGTLSAADTPDTRSWSSLPGEIHLLRLSLPPGPQDLQVQVGPQTDSRRVDIRPENFQLFNFSRLR